MKGKKEYNQWKDKKKLTRKEAMNAMCYVCNGEEDSNADCLAKASCPMYSFRLYPDDF